MKKRLLIILCFLMAVSGHVYPQASEDILVDLSSLEGIELNRDNVWNYQIFSSFSGSRNVKVRGRISLRNLDHFIEYTYNYTVVPGINRIDRGLIRPEFRFSSTDIRDLFDIYNKLPQGIIEYCVEVIFNAPGAELANSTNSQCTFYKNDDLFLINLVYPENNAEITEYNPLLTWMVTAPYTQALQYKIRLTELKEGQSPVTAINRNYTIYEERNLRNTSQLYPTYARSLEANIPYVWTVDVFYNSVLLGGSEVWKFTIVEDTSEYGISINNSYIDIQREKGILDIYTANELKLKYNLQESRTDTLSFKLYNDKGQELKLPKNMQNVPLVYGDNRILMDFSELRLLKHMKMYRMVITNGRQQEFIISFKYVDEELIRVK